MSNEKLVKAIEDAEKLGTSPHTVHTPFAPGVGAAGTVGNTGTTGNPR